MNEFIVLQKVSSFRVHVRDSILKQNHSVNLAYGKVFLGADKDWAPMQRAEPQTAEP